MCYKQRLIRTEAFKAHESQARTPATALKQASRHQNTHKMRDNTNENHVMYDFNNESNSHSARYIRQTELRSLQNLRTNCKSFSWKSIDEISQTSNNGKQGIQFNSSSCSYFLGQKYLLKCFFS